MLLSAAASRSLIEEYPPLSNVVLVIYFVHYEVEHVHLLHRSQIHDLKPLYPLAILNLPLLFVFDVGVNRILHRSLLPLSLPLFFVQFGDYFFALVSMEIQNHALIVTQRIKSSVLPAARNLPLQHQRIGRFYDLHQPLLHKYTQIQRHFLLLFLLFLFFLLLVLALSMFCQFIFTLLGLFLFFLLLLLSYLLLELLDEVQHRRLELLQFINHNIHGRLVILNDFLRSDILVLFKELRFS